MVAAARGNGEVVTRLLALGATTGSPAIPVGRDAIHLALLGGHEDTALQLVEPATDLDNQTTEGKTYLMLALETGINPHSPGTAGAEGAPRFD